MSNATEKTGKSDHWASNMGTGRIDALCDGVFAIAMTLLVLELSVPHLVRTTVSNTHPSSFQEMLTEFYSYVLGFLVLGIYWVLHTYMFHFIKRCNGVLLWLNIVFLVFASLVPFSTKVLDINEALVPNSQGEWNAGSTFFSITTMVSIVILLIIWLYATHRHRLVDPDIDERTVTALSRIILIGLGINLVGVVLAIFTPLGALLSLVALAFMIVATAYGRHVRALSGVNAAST